MFSSKETRLYIDYVWKILLQLQHILILTARCSDVERTVILYYNNNNDRLTAFDPGHVLIGNTVLE